MLQSTAEALNIEETYIQTPPFLSCWNLGYEMETQLLTEDYYYNNVTFFSSKLRDRWAADAMHWE